MGCDRAIPSLMRQPADCISVMSTRVWLGYVDAVDEKTAREQAVKEFKISEALRNRIAVQREG